MKTIIPFFLTAILVIQCLSGFSQEIKNFSKTGNQVTKFDNLGMAVDAHDGEIAYFEGTYYLYGTSYDCGFEWNNKIAPFCGFKSYSSKDMIHWEDEGFLFDAQNELWQSRCNGATYGCFRPHVVFNEKTKNYVLWINVYDNVSGYRVFVSKKPTGPFIEVDEPQIVVNADKPAAGLNNGDHDLFVDDDGACYLALTDWRRGGAIVIEKLSDDYLTGTGIVSSLVTETRTEAPGVFKRGDTYYVTYSDPNCGYCAGTGTSYKTAKSILGPWSEGIQINDNSCGGQPSFVSTIKVDSKTIYLYGSDLWNNAAKNEALANYFWAPLTFAEDGSINPIECIRAFEMPRLSPEEFVKRNATHEDEFKAECGIGNQVQRAQLFIPEISGNLKTFSFTTLKSGYPNAPLQLEIYETKDESLTNRKLIKSFSVDESDIGWSAKPIQINANISVQKGKKYVILIRSETGQGCYGFAYQEDLVPQPNPSFLSNDNGTTYIKEAQRKMKFDLDIVAKK